MKNTKRFVMIIGLVLFVAALPLTYVFAQELRNPTVDTNTLASHKTTSKVRSYRSISSPQSSMTLSELEEHFKSGKTIQDIYPDITSEKFKQIIEKQSNKGKVRTPVSQQKLDALGLTADDVRYITDEQLELILQISQQTKQPVEEIIKKINEGVKAYEK